MPATVVFSGVGKTRAEMRQALRAGVRCFNVESESELELLPRSRARRAARACQPARQPRRRRRDAPVHLHRAQGQQVRHRARASRSRPTAGRRCRGSRSPASTATSARRSPTLAPYLDALDRLLDLVEAVKRGHPASRTSTSAVGSASPTATKRRPRRRRWWRACATRSTRAATAIGVAARARAARWSAMPACWSPRCCTSSRATAKNFCIVDAAMNDLMRPAMYEAWMAIVECERRSGRLLLRCRRPGLRIGRLAGPGSRAGRRPAIAGRAVCRRLRHEHVQQLQQPGTRGRGDGQRSPIVAGRKRESAAELFSHDQLLPDERLSARRCRARSGLPPPRGRPPARRESQQRRPLDAAARIGMRAARMEGAAARRIQRIRHLALHRRARAPLMWMSGSRRAASACTDAAARANSSALAASSTSRPRYITPTWSPTWRTTARLCEMKR